MLKKSFYAICFAALFAACGKPTPSSTPCDSTPSAVVATAAEIAFLQNFVNTNGIAATQHSSGFFYTIQNPGTGISPAGICSTTSVKYVGTILGSSTPFDANTNGTTFLLANLIVGWQKGIPLLKKGGTIDLYLPPSLAYGAGGSGSIPPNSYLKFTIELLDVSN